MTMIRAAFALFALTVCILIDAREAAAEIYRPWCVVYTGRGGRSCSFTSFEQCMMTGGPGTGGSCELNPWYLWYGKSVSPWGVRTMAGSRPEAETPLAPRRAGQFSGGDDAGRQA
jgi:hypothetical protein